uniref:Cytochrome P450 n=1 Tax=Musca domestica TaxID=7370 RepID=A0A1I8M6N2_MUSDO
MNFWMIIIWTLLSSLLSYLRVKYNYWDLQGVKQLKPHFLLGHLGKLKSVNHRQVLKEVYDNFKSTTKLAGFYIYTKPVAVILNLDLVKAVLIKDFSFFASRMVYKNEKDILSQHLFNLGAPQWRPLRNKLSPAFTSGKMQFMFPCIQRVADNYVKAFERGLEESESLDVYDLNGRFTVDVISNCLFGFESNCLENPDEEFRQISKKILGRTDFGIKSYLFKTTYVDLMKYFGAKRFPQFIENFFGRVVSEGFVEREKTNVVRNDFVDVLKEFRKSGELNLSNEQISAQFFVFFLAGFETSSTAMSNLLFELARHEDIQTKLRQHIKEVLKRHDNTLSYESLVDMKYLDQVITETLRLYPALAFLQRVALEDYKIPNSDITIEKNTEIFIPVQAIHHDPEIYENPKEFQPDRFTPSEETKRHSQAFLGFGDGPRNCIGLRFGRMQMKIGLITLLMKF